MTTEPTIGEVSRRLDALTDEVRTGNRGLNERLDRMPTSELLTAYLSKTDADVRAVKEDVDELKSSLAALQRQLVEARRWAIGAAISVGGLLLGAVPLIRSLS